jgi:hypothetical protein
MDQAFLNWVYGGAMALLGWFGRMLWEADKELRQDLTKLREDLPHTYVSKDDYREDLRDIKQMLEKIFDRLEGKVDKK